MLRFDVQINAIIMQMFHLQFNKLCQAGGFWWRENNLWMLRRSVKMFFRRFLDIIVL